MPVSRQPCYSGRREERLEASRLSCRRVLPGELTAAFTSLDNPIHPELWPEPDDSLLDSSGDSTLGRRCLASRASIFDRSIGWAEPSFEIERQLVRMSDVDFRKSVSQSQSRCSVEYFRYWRRRHPSLKLPRASVFRKGARPKLALTRGNRLDHRFHRPTRPRHARVGAITMDLIAPVFGLRALARHDDRAPRGIDLDGVLIGGFDAAGRTARPAFPLRNRRCAGRHRAGRHCRGARGVRLRKFRFPE